MEVPDGPLYKIKPVSPILPSKPYSPSLERGGVGGPVSSSPKPGSTHVTPSSPKLVNKSIQKTVEDMRTHIAKLKTDLEAEKVRVNPLFSDVDALRDEVEIG